MPKLYVVPTPIGNLEDMTYRAVKVLKEVQLILAEDTRTSAFLLKHFDIETKMKSYHKFNEHKISSFVEELFDHYRTIALISDAGTPGISDPGYLIVRKCIDAGIETECLPGATAFVPALVNSGLPNDKFLFEGFLPVKKGRQTKLKELAECQFTFVLYESPFRVIKTLNDLSLFLGKDRRISVSREISKKFEETYRGTVEMCIQYFSEKSIKGEFVFVIEGKNN
ncbi:MAG: 16S rRNA (cytidine(1402)-2'-O)-methyltransferase [Bacteroidales bacterium]|nr:16S rRNA (cytidine(1402)-2'-O)-methyltransferase [Bacteroidales bacterium]